MSRHYGKMQETQPMPLRKHMGCAKPSFPTRQKLGLTTLLDAAFEHLHIKGSSFSPHVILIGSRKDSLSQIFQTEPIRLDHLGSIRMPKRS